MSDLAEKPPEMTIAETLRRIEETQAVHSQALGLILGAASGGSIQPPVELFEKLGVRTTRIVPAVIGS